MTRYAACGAGRMGRGIAIAVRVRRPRDRPRRFAPARRGGGARLRGEAFAEIRAEPRDPGRRSARWQRAQIDAIAARVRWVDGADAPAALADAEMVFEGVPETLEAKRDALAEIGRRCRADAVVTSTTSSILVSQLAPLVAHGPSASSTCTGSIRPT